LRHELLTLLCPDWRGATLIVEAKSLKIVHFNAQAGDMLRRGYPLSIRGGRLELPGRDGTGRLQRALETAAGNEGTVILDDTTLENGTSAIRCRLLHTLLPDAVVSKLDAPTNLAVVEVTCGPVVLSAADLRALGAAFALTSAEIAILRLIGDGLSLAEIAAQRGVEVMTVRNQCKQLLAKTRSRRQSDLVRLVVSFCGRPGARQEANPAQLVAAE